MEAYDIGDRASIGVDVVIDLTDAGGAGGRGRENDDDYEYRGTFIYLAVLHVDDSHGKRRMRGGDAVGSNQRETINIGGSRPYPLKKADADEIVR